MYVIVEECNVLLDDDHLIYNENVGVAESRLTAEMKIEKLKEKIMTAAAENGWIVADFFNPANGGPGIIVNVRGVLWSDKREYTWRIEEHELIKES